MNAGRLVIVGAGPIGLHAALHAVDEGYDVTVLERGKAGAEISKWSHVRLFTPFSMNSTHAGRLAVAESTSLPEIDDLLTGADYIDRYLQPLADTPLLTSRIHTSTEVIAAGRRDGTKSSWIGMPERARSPFRVLVRQTYGRETVIDCDILLDCTGLTARHRFIGAGGIPCPGETTHLGDDDYRIASGRGSADSNDHVVVVGSGYSAATSICNLLDSSKRITWITRGNRRTPIDPIPNDSLTERATLTELANHLAQDANSSVTWRPGLRIDSISRTSFGPMLNVTDQDGLQQQIECHRIVANPGFRPDSRPFEELQIHRCYATEGPMKMAVHLLGETTGDCLSQTAPGVDLLRNPEPGFFILGAASYGRDSRFLLKNGLEQIEQLFESLVPVTEAAL